MLQSYFSFLFLLNLTSNPSVNSSQSKGKSYLGCMFFFVFVHTTWLMDFIPSLRDQTLTFGSESAES